MQLTPIEIKKSAITPEKMYLWRRPCGEITPVWLSDCGDYLDEWEDCWEIEGLAGELFGPITLPDQPE